MWSMLMCLWEGRRSLQNHAKITELNEREQLLPLLATAQVTFSHMMMQSV